MERRKFVIGAGALASGSAAAMGTGAFASVRAERNLAVETTGDASAYVQMQAAGSGDYADITDGTLEIQLDELNANADTGIYDVAKVTNGGNNGVNIQIAADGGAIGEFPSDSPLTVFWTKESTDGTGGVAQLNAFTGVPTPSWYSGTVKDPDVGTGEEIYLHFLVALNEEVNTLNSTNIDNVPDDLGLYIESRDSI